MSELQILLLLLGIFLVTVIASNVWLAFQERPGEHDDMPKHGRDGTK
jgi:hypothetical protein